MTVVLHPGLERLEIEAHAACVRRFARHRQIGIAAGGVLKAEADGRPAGTVFAIASVPSVAAAEAAADELLEVAGLAPGEWAHGWREHNGSLEIDVYPEPSATFLASFVRDR